MESQEKVLVEEPPSRQVSKKDYKIEVIENLEICHSIWEKFSPKTTLFDTWEFRFAFYLGYKFKPYFILLKKENEIAGVLPLWYDSEQKKYFWFGSNWQEENKFFVKDKRLIPRLLEAAPSPLELNAIDYNSIYISPKYNFKFDDSKYIIELKNFRNHEDFLMTLKKNSRRDLRKDRNRILKQKPKVVFNKFSDFENLIKLSINRMAQKGTDADWYDKRRIETFSNVMKLAGKSYQIRMISVYIGSKIAGVDLIALYNKTYFAIKCGYDVKNFPGIGNFVNLVEIDDAIDLKMKKIDFLQNNYHWKSRWFQAIPLLIFEK